MARKAHHEDHVNHEAWAIPYGDLVTLLLAFFVVMYAISSLNEGKYRVLADAMAEAFGGPPRAITPIQLGTIEPSGSRRDSAPPMSRPGARGPIAPVPLRDWPERPRIVRTAPNPSHATTDSRGSDAAAETAARERLAEISAQVEDALADMIERDLIRVRRERRFLEVEIRSDILFASGVATPEPIAVDILDRLARVLQPFSNPLRIEGHTDAVPISTSIYPTNWELSAARAASVVHLFAARAVPEARMAIVGHADTRPIAGNDTPEGRRLNRRVVVVVLARPESGGEHADRASEPSQPIGSRVSQSEEQ